MSIGRLLCVLLFILVPCELQNWETTAVVLEKPPAVVAPPPHTILTEEESTEKEEEILERVPVFTTSVSTKLVNQGEQIRLPCFVDKLEGFVLLWKRGETIISVGKRISFPDNRAQILSEKNGNWLLIESSKIEDEGTYTCQFSAVQPREIEHRVLVRTLPEVHAVQDHVAVREGDLVNLSCYIKSGYPQPEIKWFKSTKGNSATYLVNGPQLMLKNVTHSTAGMYRCRADNGFPQYSEDIVTVVVLHKPYIIQNDGSSYVHADGKTNATLSCKVSAFPKAKVSWFYIDHLGKAHGFENATINESEDSVYSIMLLAPNARLGEYECRAVNEYGAQKARMKVSNLVGPILFESHKIENGSNMYNLTWSGESMTTVTKFNLNIYKDNNELINTPVKPSSQTGNIWNGWYIMSELEENSIYTASVAGFNSHGEGPRFGPWQFGPENTESSVGRSSGKPALISIILLIYLMLIRY